MTATIFTGGVIWTGSGDETDALLVADGVVQALGDEAEGVVGTTPTWSTWQAVS